MNSIEEIYKQYYQEIYRFCYYRLGNKENAEDITSDVFMELAKNQAEIQNIRAWLYKVARNLIYDKYLRTPNIKDSLEINNEIEESFIDQNVNVETLSIEKTLLEQIQKEINNIDSITADIIILRVWEGLSFLEIANITNLNESTVKLRFYRGITKLKNNLLNNKIMETNTVSENSQVVQKEPFLSKSMKYALSFALFALIVSVLSFGGYKYYQSNKDDNSDVADDKENNDNEDKTNESTEKPEIKEEEIVENNVYEPTIPEGWKVIEGLTSLNGQSFDISFALPSQNSYTDSGIVDPSTFNPNATKSWFIDSQATGSLTSNIYGFRYTDYLRIGFTPDGKKGIPCGAGCAGETMITIYVDFENTGNLEENVKQIEDFIEPLPKETALAFTINENIKIEKWGIEVQKMNISGGIESLTENYYVFLVNGKSYLLSYYGDESLVEQVLNSISIQNESNQSDTLRFESDNYNLSFNYSKNLGEINANNIPEYFNVEVISFSNSTLTIHYPRFEGGTAGEPIDNYNLTTKDGKNFKVTVLQSQGGVSTNGLTIIAESDYSGSGSSRVTIIGGSTMDEFANAKLELKQIVESMELSL